MKNACTRGLFFSLCLTLACSTAALAGAVRGDANGDGKLTCSEAKTETNNRFKAIDTNKNKALSMNEMEAAMADIHKEMDTNGDGMVSVEEYVTYWCGAAPEAEVKKTAAKGGKKPIFNKMDANQDGSVSTAECVALWTIRFNDADENKDGKLTGREYTQSVIMWFGDLDGADKDSSVSFSEWTTYWVGKCQAEKMKKALDKM